jgi:hypothetical protein
MKNTEITLVDVTEEKKAVGIHGHRWDEGITKIIEEELLRVMNFGVQEMWGNS